MPGVTEYRAGSGLWLLRALVQDIEIAGVAKDAVPLLPGKLPHHAQIHELDQAFIHRGRSQVRLLHQHGCRGDGALLQGPVHPQGGGRSPADGADTLVVVT